MTWQLQLGGHVDTIEEERAIIEKFQSVLSDADVHWHTWLTAFHGVGDTANVLHNVAPAEEVASVPTTATESDDTPVDVPPTEEATPNQPVGGGTIPNG